MYRNSFVFFPNTLRQWLTSCPSACWRSWHGATPFKCPLSLLASLSWGGFKLYHVFRTSYGATFFEGVEFAVCTDEGGVSLYWWSAACSECSIELRNRRNVSTLLVIEALPVTCFLAAQISFQPVLIGNEANGIHGMLPDGSIFTVGAECVGRQIPCVCLQCRGPASVRRQGDQQNPRHVCGR